MQGKQEVLLTEQVRTVDGGNNGGTGAPPNYFIPEGYGLVRLNARDQKRKKDNSRSRSGGGSRHGARFTYVFGSADVDALARVHAGVRAGFSEAWVRQQLRARAAYVLQQARWPTAVNTIMTCIQLTCIQLSGSPALAPQSRAASRALAVSTRSTNELSRVRAQHSPKTP